MPPGLPARTATHRTARSCVEGNALCAQCHLPARFDAREHHHHEPGSASAQCVNCHMPTKNYMVVDARRDHSIRVPRPDLSVSLGTPNACTQCYVDRSAEWAAQAASAWFPRGRQMVPHFGTALHARRSGAADAEPQLDRLILDQNQPAVARASALLLLPRYATSASEPTLQTAIADPDPLVRLAAPPALTPSASRAAIPPAASLPHDPSPAGRLEPAPALTPTGSASLPPEPPPPTATDPH